jgi:hypothetical protein
VKQGLILEQEAGKSNQLNELDVKKAIDGFDFRNK